MPESFAAFPRHHITFINLSGIISYDMALHQIQVLCMILKHARPQPKAFHPLAACQQAGIVSIDPWPIETEAAGRQPTGTLIKKSETERGAGGERGGATCEEQRYWGGGVRAPLKPESKNEALHILNEVFAFRGPHVCHVTEADWTRDLLWTPQLRAGHGEKKIKKKGEHPRCMQHALSQPRHRWEIGGGGMEIWPLEGGVSG